jgi:putative nucleotidyltransferase with HDIG domain
MSLHVHPDIAALSPYVPGKPIDELQRELGLTRVIKLASNENPLGPSPKALAVLSEGAANLHRYPDGGAFRLREALADRWKVTADHIILGNGSDEILGLLARTFLAPGDEAVMADHTFVIYRMEVTAAHGTIVTVPLKQWRYDLPAMAEAMTPRTRLLFLCNPNNPTGTMVSADEVERLLARVPEHVIIVFDEAYFEYVRSAEFPDSMAYVRQGRNAIVLRTFSKIHGSLRLRAQTDDLEAHSRDLVESSRQLEATLLETIETLNAAVEARDPYTAGHSQRVRRVALAIGRELRLPAKQLGALGTAALFHDIGKIGMPDSILTKPDKLTRAEAAVMREHVTRGAEIVARISSLADSVPTIRHHHERWDGLGYPDRLRGTDVPVEAAIIAIADTWDAMTTDRPYAAALPMDAALEQLEAGRGKQFNPAVVDAFLSVSRRRPAEVLPPAAEQAVVAAAS